MRWRTQDIGICLVTLYTKKSVMNITSEGGVEGQGCRRGLGRGREQVVEATTLLPDADASVPALLPVPATEASLKGL